MVSKVILALCLVLAVASALPGPAPAGGWGVGAGGWGPGAGGWGAGGGGWGAGGGGWGAGAGGVNPWLPPWLATAPWMPQWTPCTTIGAVCVDCTTRAVCTKIGGIQKACTDPTLPYCNLGQCSATPSTECAPAEAAPVAGSA